MSSPAQKSNRRPHPQARPRTTTVPFATFSVHWNNVSDVSPLTFLPDLKGVHARGNPLSEASLNEHILTLNKRHVYVALSSFHPFMDTESPFSIDLVFLDDFAEWEQEVWYRVAKRWEAAIQTELPDYEFPSAWFGTFGEHSIEIPAGEQIDDLRIYMTKFSGIDPHLRGTSGSASPRLLRSSSLPIIGSVEINDQYFSVHSEFFSTRSERHYLIFAALLGLSIKPGANGAKASNRTKLTTTSYLLLFTDLNWANDL